MSQSLRPLLVAIVGPTASGKSALGLALAEWFGGEIVSCDSTVVYRGFDIGTDKVPLAVRRDIPHYMIDVASPTEVYSAARYASDASAVIREVTGRGRLPILVGGTGLYYRAVARGLFPGPGRDLQLRERLIRRSRRRGVETLHRLVRRFDPASAERIQPRDEKRLIRALEVYMLTGRPLTEHFAATESPLRGYDIVAIGLRLPADQTARRVVDRVERQFADGLVDEVRRLLASGVPPDAPPFGGLVYRQVMEYLRGARDEAATRELIVRENRRYARQQLIWFKKEPNLQWICGPGEHPDTVMRAGIIVTARLRSMVSYQPRRTRSVDYEGHAGHEGSKESQ